MVFSVITHALRHSSSNPQEVPQHMGETHFVFAWADVLSSTRGHLLVHAVFSLEELKRTIRECKMQGPAAVEEAPRGQHSPGGSGAAWVYLHDERPRFKDQHADLGTPS